MDDYQGTWFCRPWQCCEQGGSQAKLEFLHPSTTGTGMWDASDHQGAGHGQVLTLPWCHLLRGGEQPLLPSCHRTTIVRLRNSLMQTLITLIEIQSKLPTLGFVTVAFLSPHPAGCDYI